MLDAADESLRYDPKFEKSLLRRSIPNLELGNLKEAESGLRDLMKEEPKNFALLKLLRRIRQPVKMKSSLMKAHLANYLRLAIIHAEVGTYVCGGCIRLKGDFFTNSYFE
jgi:predicted Zn-dependent protease